MRNVLAALRLRRPPVVIPAIYRPESRGFNYFFVRRLLVIGVFVFFELTLGLADRSWGIEIFEPKEGAVFAPGETVTVKARPSSGEKLRLVTFNTNLREVGFGPVDLIPPYEWEFTLPKEHVGIVKIFAGGAPVKDSDSSSRVSIAINVALPPTTTVQSIDALIDNNKKTFLDIARKPNGELVVPEINDTARISVGGLYSDGVERIITTHPDIRYRSEDEKVAIVFPPRTESNPGDYALVKSKGPGETQIIVEYGAYRDVLTVKVKECPYIEGVTDKEGCPF